MGLNGIFYDERAQDAKSYGKVLRSLFNDGVLDGCTVGFTANTISFAKGHFVACGRLTEIEGVDVTTLYNIISSGFVRVKYVIDLTQPGSDVAFNQGAFEYDYASTLGEFSALTQEDINDTGELYEIEMAVGAIAGGIVTGITRSMGVAAKKIGFIGTDTTYADQIKFVTVAPDSATQTANPHTLYIVVA